MKIILIILLVLSGLTGSIAQTLAPVGNGINSSYGIYGGTVNFNNKLYASDGGAIYSWDGNSWINLNVSLNYRIQCMEVFNGKLYVAGWFTTFNGMPANRIVSYDGTTWNTLGTGIGVDPNVTGGVEKMTVYNNELIVLGGFIQAGSIPANSIAKWNGTSWASLGSGISGLSSIPSMVTFNNDLYVFTQFNNAGGVPVQNVAKWNGTAWSGVGNGLNRWPISSVVFNNNIYVGHWIGQGDNSSTLSKWDGNTWSPVETNLSDTLGGIVNDLKVYNGCLYIAGILSNIDGIPINGLARYDGNNWFPVGNGVNNSPVSLTEYNNELFVAGRFQYSGSTPVNNIAKIQGAPNCSLLGIYNRAETEQALSIYPNPASDIIYIKKVNQVMEKISFNILNPLGQSEARGFTINNQISIKDLKKGMYVIHLESGKSSMVFKFIKE